MLARLLVAATKFVRERDWSDRVGPLRPRITGVPWRRRSRSALFLAALISAPLFLFGCTNSGGTIHAAQTIQVGTELAADQVLNRHLEDDPRTLDPSLTEDVV